MNQKIIRVIFMAISVVLVVFARENTSDQSEMSMMLIQSTLSDPNFLRLNDQDKLNVLQAIFNIVETFNEQSEPDERKQIRLRPKWNQFRQDLEMFKFFQKMLFSV
jgi:hypothetical protein